MPVEAPFERLAQKIIPQAKLLRTWPLAGGISAQMIAFEVEHTTGRLQKMIVRYYSERTLNTHPHVADDQFRLLQVMHSSGLCTPNPLYCDPSGEIFGKPCLVLEYITGNLNFSLSNLVSAMHQFAFQLTSLIKKQGMMKVFCLEENLLGEAVQQLSDRLVKEDIGNCDVAITGCEFLVARTGSIVMSSAQLSGRTTSAYAPIHICVAHASQVVFDIKDALQELKNKYKSGLPSLITFASGPSRTADIEKTLVVGVHGPKEVYLFLLED